MLRIVNHNRGIIICCPFVCGTSFLHLRALKDDNWEHVRGNWHIPENYVIARIVRDPIQRFHSWYNKFILASDVWYGGSSNRFITDKVSLDNINDWFEHFRIVMHYDGHTMLQKYNHIMDKRFNIDNIIYVKSNHVQKFINYSDTNYEELEYQTPYREQIDKYLQELYEIDINWLKTIEVHE